jgi:hypothetical protein
MGLTITSKLIRSSASSHTAELEDQALADAWSVSWLPGRVLTRAPGLRRDGDRRRCRPDPRRPPHRPRRRRVRRRDDRRRLLRPHLRSGGASSPEWGLQRRNEPTSGRSAGHGPRPYQGRALAERPFTCGDMEFRRRALRRVLFFLTVVLTLRILRKALNLPLGLPVSWSGSDPHPGRVGRTRPASLARTRQGPRGGKGGRPQMARHHRGGLSWDSARKFVQLLVSVIGPLARLIDAIARLH